MFTLSYISDAIVFWMLDLFSAVNNHLFVTSAPFYFFMILICRLFPGSKTINQGFQSHILRTHFHHLQKTYIVHIVAASSFSEMEMLDTSKVVLACDGCPYSYNVFTGVCLLLQIYAEISILVAFFNEFDILEWPMAFHVTIIGELSYWCSNCEQLLIQTLLSPTTLKALYICGCHTLHDGLGLASVKRLCHQTRSLVTFTELWHSGHWSRISPPVNSRVILVVIQYLSATMISRVIW